MNDPVFVLSWMFAAWLSIFIFAFLEQPYWMAAMVSILVIKQLGRINATLGDKNEQ